MENKIEKGKYYKFLIYLVALVLINLVSLNMFFRVDLTKNNLYSLSKASKNVVATLKEPLTVNVFFSKNIPAPYNNVERYLHDLLEEYSIHANNRFNYRFYNVTAEEGDLSKKAKENRELAQSYGIHPVNVQTIENDQAKVQRVYMGMVFIHGNVVENLNSITSTEGLEYQVTTTIKKMNNKISALLNLDEEIKVNLYHSSSFQDLQGIIELKGIGNVRDQVKGIVDELNKKNYNKLKLLTFDPTKQSVPEDDLKPFIQFKLQWNPIKAPNGREIPQGEGLVALGIKYKDKSFEKNLLTKNVALTQKGLVEQFQIIPEEKIKGFIDENVDNLIQINDNIGYVSSNGTLPLMPDLPPQFAMMQQNQSDLKVFNDVVSKNYTIKQIDLSKEEIPDSIDTLIIAGATEQFNDWQLFQIDQFLMKGKSLAIFADPFKEIKQNRGGMNRGFQQPVYLPINTGLEKLLDTYGLKVKRSYLMDSQCFINQDPRTGEMPIYYAPKITKKNINYSFDFMSNINQLVLIKCAPLEILEDKMKENKIKYTSLLSSSDQAWEMKERINLMPMFIRPPQSKDQFAQYPLAYLIEGEMGSHYKGKQIPQKPIEEKKEEEGPGKKEAEKAPEKIPPKDVKKSGLTTTQPFIEKGKPGKIFIIGSTEFLKNNVLISEDFANSVFLINTLDYLNNKEGIAVLRAKKQRFNPVKDAGLFARRFAQYLNIAALPILVIIIGAMVWIKRGNRKRLIRNKFKSKQK